jgi:hypothetical protein
VRSVGSDKVMNQNWEPQACFEKLIGCRVVGFLIALYYSTRGINGNEYSRYLWIGRTDIEFPAREKRRPWRGRWAYAWASERCRDYKMALPRPL